jgi:uncharacterized membrane protein
MKNQLFPHVFQSIGWILFVLSLIVGALMFFEVLPGNGIVSIILNDIAIIGTVLGALFIVCSKELIEDEMTMSIRSASLLNALYVYVILLVLSTLFVNGLLYLYVMYFNLVLFPIIFVFSFKYKMHKYNTISEDEEQN